MTDFVGNIWDVLSDEIGRLFYEYFNGDDMADVI